MYTITTNPNYNTLEITFDSKPAEAVREALKALSFRWHNVKKLWYGKATEEEARAAIEAAEAGTEAPAPTVSKTAPKLDKNALRVEFSKAWSSPKMIDYCVGKVAAVAIMEDGSIITVDKKPIEKDFCFGESGYDYDEAQEAAAHARTSQDYFRRENMKEYKSMIEDLKEAATLKGRYFIAIHHTHYNGQAEDCKLAYFELRRDYEILNDLGGSAYLDRLQGQKITEAGSGRNYRIATADEANAIIEAYETAAAAHSKRVETYLKKYGLSQVHTWTYWRDA